MFDTILHEGARRALATLVGRRLLPPDTYLAGGTALALQLGYRESFDLDLFTPTDFDVSAILKNLEQLDGFALTRTAKWTILGDIPGTQVSLFRYDYPLIRPTIEYVGMPLASLADLGAMKLNAIADRGLRRDFVDLVVLMEQSSLAQLLQDYDEKYGTLAINHIHLMKSLVFFDEADADVQPRMLKDGYEWESVKQRMVAAVSEYRAA